MLFKGILRVIKYKNNSFYMQIKYYLLNWEQVWNVDLSLLV